MKNLCPSRQEKHASGGKEKKQTQKCFLHDDSKAAAKGAAGPLINGRPDSAVWTGGLAQS